MVELQARLDDIITMLTDAGANQIGDLYLIRVNVEEIYDKLSDIKIREMEIQPGYSFTYIKTEDLNSAFGDK